MVYVSHVCGFHIANWLYLASSEEGLKGDARSFHTFSASLVKLVGMLATRQRSLERALPSSLMNFARVLILIKSETLCVEWQIRNLVSADQMIEILTIGTFRYLLFHSGCG